MHSIDSVRQELIKWIKSDYVLQHCFFDIKNQLLFHLNKKVDSITNYKSLYYKIKLYYDLLVNSYDAKLIDSIVECTNNNEKKLIIALTSTYISRCIDKGWSSKALNKKIDLGNNKEQKQFLEKMLNFQPQKYIVLFPNRISVIPPRGKTKDESKEYLKNQFLKFNIKSLSKQEIICRFPEITQSEISDGEYLMILSESMDVYGAAHNAIVNISNVLSVFSFFSAISSYDVTKKRIIVYNTDSPYTANLNYLDLYSTYEYLDSSSNIYSRVEDIINAESTEKELKQKLISSFNYTNLSHISASVEEKYMNMWIALESLLRTEIQENIIGNILLSIPSACCLRYIYRKIRNFIEDCGRCEVDLNLADLEINLQDGDKEGLVKKMIILLRSESYEELLNRCTVNSLLSYRCEEIKSIVSNEQVLINDIKSHRKNVEWQLDRLYRIRNEIAHSAIFQQISIIRYTEHLYDYLATYISEIIRFATQKDTSNFELISVGINDNYSEFDFVANEKGFTSKKDFLKSIWNSGIIDLI